MKIVLELRRRRVNRKENELCELTLIIYGDDGKTETGRHTLVTKENRYWVNDEDELLLQEITKIVEALKEQGSSPAVNNYKEVVGNDNEYHAVLDLVFFEVKQVFIALIQLARDMLNTPELFGFTSFADAKKSVATINRLISENCQTMQDYQQAYASHMQCVNAFCQREENNDTITECFQMIKQAYREYAAEANSFPRQVFFKMSVFRPWEHNKLIFEEGRKEYVSTPERVALKLMSAISHVKANHETGYWGSRGVTASRLAKHYDKALGQMVEKGYISKDYANALRCVEIVCSAMRKWEREVDIEQWVTVGIRAPHPSSHIENAMWRAAMKGDVKPSEILRQLLSLNENHDTQSQYVNIALANMKKQAKELGLTDRDFLGQNQQDQQDQRLVI